MSLREGHILVSEIKSAYSYLFRLLQVTIKMNPNISSLKRTKQQLIKFLTFYFEKMAQVSSFQSSINDLEIKDLLELEQLLAQTKFFLINALELKYNLKQLSVASVEIINNLYQECYNLHSHFDPHDLLKVQLPRITVIRIINYDLKINQRPFTPRFFLPLENVELHSPQARLFSLDKKRRHQHETFLKTGHDFIAQKNYPQALTYFVQANRLLQTAQSLTLVGWAHSLMGDFTKAKEFCFEAIKKDPDYGNPYNDIGSYLLSEGKIKESFSWFALAKKAKYYLNREFPYINAAKAHLMQQNYRGALNEFMEALILVPYHKELQKTVNRLKSFVYKKDVGQGHQPPPG